MRCIIIFFPIVLALGGCGTTNGAKHQSQNRMNDTTISGKQNTIQLPSERPVAREAERILNNMSGTLASLSIDWPKWEKESLMQERYSYNLLNEEVHVTVVLTNSAADANALGAANFTNTTTSRWGINGAVLFLVEGKDQWKVSKAASELAGEE